MRRIARLAWQLLVCGAFLSACSNSVGPDEGLAAQISALQHRADLVSGANDVKRLQRAYGFYWDKGIWDEVADLRLRAFIMGGAPKREGTGSSDAVFGEATAFGEATYENRYVKQNGVWKISRLYAYFNMYTPYSRGWGEVGMPNTNPEAALPPDRPPTVKYETYPTPGLVPYHYPNPVTGRAWKH